MGNVLTHLQGVQHSKSPRFCPVVLVGLPGGPPSGAWAPRSLPGHLRQEVTREPSDSNLPQSCTV